MEVCPKCPNCQGKPDVRSPKRKTTVAADLGEKGQYFFSQSLVHMLCLFFFSEARRISCFLCKDLNYFTNYHQIQLS